MDYITAFSDGLQLLLNNGKSNFISPAIREATDRHCMIQIELALIILIKRFSLHPQQAHTQAHTHAQAHRRTLQTLQQNQRNRQVYRNIQKAVVKTRSNVEMSDSLKPSKNLIFGDNPALHLFTFVCLFIYFMRLCKAGRDGAATRQFVELYLQ